MGAALIPIAASVAGTAIGGLMAGGATKALSKATGANNAYQGVNPYSQAVLQDQLNKSGDLYASQRSLAQELVNQQAGLGPNPAQTQYQMNQQANIANAQGLIASQRGLNPALAARMGANIAAASNQKAALGSALLQQNQQLQATQNLGSLYGQMQAGNLDQQQLYTNAEAARQGINQKVASQNAQTNAQLASGIMQGVGSGFAMGASALGKSSGGSGGTAMAGGPMDAGSPYSGSMYASEGGKVPGKAKVSGDSSANDTVHAMLSPDEIVIPRSKAKDPEKAKEFIDHLLKSKSDSGEDGSGYGSVLELRRKNKELEKRIKALEKKKAS